MGTPVSALMGWKDWIKENVIIIDIGINRDLNNKLCGDVDYEDVIKKVSFIILKCKDIDKKERNGGGCLNRYLFHFVHS